MAQYTLAQSVCYRRPERSMEYRDMHDASPKQNSEAACFVGVRNGIGDSSWDRELGKVVDAHDFARAATLIVRRHGAELLRFLHVRLRSRSLAEDAFTQVCESVWLGLPSFRWQSSLRTWLYILARNAANDVCRVERRRREVSLQTSQAEIWAACEQVRATTPWAQRTEVKERVRELRAQLREDQQTLLILRVDRGLSWKELAVILGEADPQAGEAELERASARVRTRFQVAKKALGELIRKAGVGPP